MLEIRIRQPTSRRVSVLLLLLTTLLGACSEEKKKGGSEDDTKDAGEQGVDLATHPLDCGECDAPSFCHEGDCVESGSTVVSGGVGNAKGEFAASTLEEAASEGPQSIAVSSETGRVYVLDQLNKRVSVYVDGVVVHAIPVDKVNAEEVAVLDSGLVVVMDRFADEFTVYDEEGAVQATSPISGDGIEKPAFVDGLYTRQDGVWMSAAGLCIRVLDTEGKPVSERTVRSGLPSPDLDTLLSVKLLDDGSVHVVTRPAWGEPKYQQAHLRFERRVSQVSAFDLDREGNVYLATTHRWRDGDEYPVERWLTVLSPELEQTRQEALPVPESSRVITRYVAVGAEGGAFYMKVDRDRVEVLRY